MSTHVVGIRLNLVFECDELEQAREAARIFGHLLAESHDPGTNTVCVVDDGQPRIKRMLFIAHETGYRLVNGP